MGALLALGVLLVSQVAMVLLLHRGDAVWQQLLLRPPQGPAAVEAGLFDVLWAVLVTDVMAR